MEERLNYFDLAENDYQFLSYAIQKGMVANLICSSSQNICERYLKHIIDSYVTDCDTTVILRTHSLKALRRFLNNRLPDFEADWKNILQADGYYFSARYPGDNAFLVEAEDVAECWDAVTASRDAVIGYVRKMEENNR